MARLCSVNIADYTTTCTAFHCFGILDSKVLSIIGCSFADI